mgnify:CR=1 FL=1
MHYVYYVIARIMKQICSRLTCYFLFWMRTKNESLSGSFCRSEGWKIRLTDRIFTILNLQNGSISRISNCLKDRRKSGNFRLMHTKTVMSMIISIKLSQKISKILYKIIMWGLLSLKKRQLVNNLWIKQENLTKCCRWLHLKNKKH